MTRNDGIDADGGPDKGRRQGGFWGAGQQAVLHGSRPINRRAGALAAVGTGSRRAVALAAVGTGSRRAVALAAEGIGNQRAGNQVAARAGSRRKRLSNRPALWVWEAAIRDLACGGANNSGKIIPKVGKEQGQQGLARSRIGDGRTPAGNLWGSIMNEKMSRQPRFLRVHMFRLVDLTIPEGYAPAKHLIVVLR